MRMRDRVNAAVNKAAAIAGHDIEKASVDFLIHMNEEDARELYVDMKRQNSYPFEEFLQITTVRVDPSIARGVVEVEFK